MPFEHLHACLAILGHGSVHTRWKYRSRIWVLGGLRCSYLTWFWRCVGTAFGHFLLGSHNFMVTALGSCVKLPTPLDDKITCHLQQCMQSCHMCPFITAKAGVGVARCPRIFTKCTKLQIIERHEMSMAYFIYLLINLYFFEWHPQNSPSSFRVHVNETIT